mgnify:CR=1 FL=1
MAKRQSKNTGKPLDQETVNEILTDYRLGHESRETSLLGRREVLTGKAKFGIFGDGKELPQIALAKQFQNGDFRSGYYRDQTWMMAAKLLTIEGFFAQLYAHADITYEPASGGRQMNGHYATRSLDENGEWKNLTEQKNSSADISPTAGQMSRLVGLAQASKVYRNHPTLKDIEEFNKFSNNGNEVAFASIGDASTSEGPFWEAMNAIGVLKVPAVISVWDDGYGISVERKYQTTKGSISEALAGFQKSKEGERGYEIFKVKAWDYANLVRTYDEAVKIARDTHTPILVHVEECTQPQGHSTSGSHERYKSKERLEWEKEFDGLAQMRKWILSNKISDEQTLDAIEKESKKKVRDAKKAAWSNFLSPIQSALAEALSGIEQLASESSNSSFINKEFDALKSIAEPEKRDIATKVRKVLRITRNEKLNARTALSNWYKDFAAKEQNAYSSHLTSESSSNAFDVEKTLPIYEGNEEKDGREILRDNFDYILENRPEVLIFGEDSGKIGGVNQGLEGLQDKHGELRVSDTGIRENTILGQGIGMAMRGLRPIAEIQYLDYLLYAIQVISDDLATVQYRSAGGQKAPVIIRTRGHRLEGIWHSGSPMGMILNSVRGVHVCVPRNMTQAAGFYNTLLQGDEPGIVIESLNGYRLKEKVPTNIGEFTVPLGEVEVIQQGKDLTILTYGSMVRMVLEASKELTALGINVEIIDAQTLLPFDLNKDTAKSLAKTNRLLIVDEDVPGGASAFLLQQVIDTQNGYYQLDSKPLTLTAKAHRPAYGSDGDYFSKPSVDDIVDAAYSIMQEANPNAFSSLD